MPSYSLDEFVYELERQDKSTMMLVLEGVGDVQFWTRSVPFTKRSNATAIAAEEIAAPEGLAGGKKGRALWLANELYQIPSLRDRVKFFVDADLDRHLNTDPVTPNVIMTDLSDFESYMLNDCSLGHILYAFGRDANTAADLEKCLLGICRPIKEARVASQFAGLRLPINDTLGGPTRQRFNRYISGSSFNAKIDFPRFATAAANNAGLNMAQRHDFNQAVKNASLAPLPQKHWAQGKDLVAALARAFSVTFEEAKRVIMLSLLSCLESLRNFPNFLSIDQFLRL